MLTIELLGGLRIRRDDQILIELPPKQTGLPLAYLALNPHRSFAREEVIATLWPDLDETAGRRKLRQSLWRLGGELTACELSNEELLGGDRLRIRLNADAVETDVAAFEERLRAASAAKSADERISLLTSALALYRGELLPGFYEESIDAERVRLADVRRAASLALVAAYKEAEDLHLALETAQRLIALDPTDEESHCEAMRLLATLGRTGDALRLYQKLVAALKQELDVEPSAKTQELATSLRKNGNGNGNGHAIENGSAKSAPNPPALISQPPAPEPREQTPSPEKEERESHPPVVEATRSRRRFVWALAVVALSALASWAGWSVRARPHVETHSDANTATQFPPPTGGDDDASAAEYGKEKWLTRITERPGDKGSEPTAMATDSGGNTYVTGFIDTEKHDVDYVTIKFDRNGREVWQRRFNGPKNDCDRARSIAVDATGCSYVTGDSYNGDTDKGGTDYDVVTIKYDPDGKELWKKRFDGPAHGADWARKVALDGTRNVYVGISAREISTRGRPQDEFVILKYNTEGDFIWKRTFDNFGKGATMRAMDADADGNVYATGSEKSASGRDEMVTVRFDANGAFNWVQHYGGPCDAGAGAGLLALDGQGHVYVAGVAGVTDPGGDGSRFVTIQYNANGDLKWLRVCPDAFTYSAIPYALAAANGYVVVVGKATKKDDSMLIASYRSNGMTLFQKSVTGVDKPTPGSWGRGAYVNSDGAVFVTGKLPSNSTRGDWDIATLEYEPSGHRLMFRMANGPANGHDSGILVEARLVAGVEGGKVSRKNRPFALLMRRGVREFAPAGAVAG